MWCSSSNGGGSSLACCYPRWDADDAISSRSQQTGESEEEVDVRDTDKRGGHFHYRFVERERKKKLKTSGPDKRNCF